LLDLLGENTTCKNRSETDAIVSEIEVFFMYTSKYLDVDEFNINPIKKSLKTEFYYLDSERK
jgi:hypothetical protein